MIIPTHNTLTWEGVTYGLHQFEKNGPLHLCYLHSGGDWHKNRTATQHEIDYITKHGKPLAAAENGEAK